ELVSGLTHHGAIVTNGSRSVNQQFRSFDCASATFQCYLEKSRSLSKIFCADTADPPLPMILSGHDSVFWLRLCAKNPAPLRASPRLSASSALNFSASSCSCASATLHCNSPTCSQAA